MGKKLIEKEERNDTGRNEEKIQKIISDFGQSLLDKKEGEVGDLLGKSLKAVCDAFAGPCCFLFRKDNTKVQFKKTFEFQIMDINPLHSEKELKGDFLNYLLPLLKKGSVVEPVEALKEVDDKLFSRLDAVGLSYLAFSSIVSDGEIYGIYGFFSYAALDKKRISYLLDTLGSYASLAFSRREAIRQTQIDKLTGLLTVEQFRHDVPVFLSENQDKDYCIVCLCTPELQMINEFFGPATTDVLILGAGKILEREAFQGRLSMGCRALFPSRFYFVFHYDADFLSRLDHDINLMVSSHIGAKASLNIYYGVYKIHDSSEPIESIIMKSNAAYEKALADPVRRTFIYDEAAGEDIAKTSKLINSFNQALIEGEFKVFVQPKYDIMTSAYCGGEVLVRWFHEGRIIQPKEFIPSFEGNGMIIKLDRYMLLQTLRIMREWLDNGINPAPLSINVSRIDFNYPNLADEIIAKIDSYRIPHRLIELEITESAFVSKKETITRFVDVMQNASIAILMDDFGSGVSSLSTLDEMNISVLKLDYQFVQRSENPDKKRKITSSIFSLAKSLHIPTIVEGVERSEDIQYLKQLGARYVQGYYYGKPMPVEEYAKLNFTPKENNERKDDFDAKGATWFNEINNPSSLGNKLFNSALASVGVFRKHDGMVSLLMKNEALSRNMEKYAKSFPGPSENFLSKVSKADYSEVLKYLDAVFNKRPHSEYIDFFYPLESGLHSVIRGKAIPIHKDGEDLYFLGEFITIRNGIDEAQDINLNLGAMKYVVDGLTLGSILLDRDGKIIYKNHAMNDWFPEYEIGYSLPEEDYQTWDVMLAQAKKMWTSRACLLGPQKKSFLVQFKNILFDGRECFMGFVNNYNFITDDKMSSRMIRSLFDVIDRYTDVNLDTGTYHHINFVTTHEDLFYFAEEGDFETGLYKVLESEADAASVPEMRQKLSLTSLRMHSEDKSMRRVRYFIPSLKVWNESDITFLKGDKGANYACIFTKDVTSDVLKDLDSLTKLFNRSAGLAKFNEFLLSGTEHRCYLCLVDFDNFKSINDNFGHPIGDQVLTSFANILLGDKETYLYPTRLGGDEFCFCLKATGDKFDVEAVIQALKNKVNDISAHLGLRNFSTSVTVGCALYPLDGLDFESLYAVADKNMYVKKGKH